MKKINFAFVAILAIILILISLLAMSHIIKVKEKYDLAIIGYINSSDGIGSQPEKFLSIFKNILKVKIISLDDKSYFKKAALDFFKDIDFESKVIIFNDVINNGYPTHKSLYALKQKDKLHKEKIWIVYSMFESSKIPLETVNFLNKEFDIILVPDIWLVDVYKNSGVFRPIFVLPLAIEPKKIQHKERLINKDYFLFGNLSSMAERKNHIKLLEAFKIVNSEKPKTKLYINSRLYNHSSQRKIEMFLNKHKNFSKNVIINKKSLSTDEYNNILFEIDAFVYPSMGEGFSIQPREAMSIGKPVIVTNNTGQATICNSGLVKCVASEIEVPACYDSTLGKCFGVQFDCRAKDLAAAMIDVYDNYEQYVKKSEELKKWVADNYSHDVLRAKYLNIVKPKKLILGNKNEITDDYLMTSSINLYNKYKELHFGKNL